uniref:Rad51 domain-containing protein n=1 Tax=Heterorhabditis bacteriophora TaxID=37862 RepID=A0A1I7WSV3_HETBA
MSLVKETALDAMIRLGVPLQLNLGIEEVDNPIACRLKPCELYEIVGELAVGKTQVCYSIVADQLMNTEYDVVWFDMNGSFRSERLLAYIEQNSPDSDRLYCLDRIFVCRIQDALSLFGALKRVANSTEMDRVRLVIVDNIGCILEKTIWTMRDGGADMQRIILQALNDLTDDGVTVITTNHLVSF